ncbi:MAG TPA: hydroxymyristoyl-ACP dehydratase [Rhodanobacter sp.]
MSATLFERSLSVDPMHPSLPGHFPGQPLVPGVLLLEQVALALQAWRAQRLARVLEAKFIAPLLPGQTAMLRLSDVPHAVTRVRFEIHRDGMLLARGQIEGAA